MKYRILELWKESVIIQGLIALSVTVTGCYLYATSQPVPIELITILTLILGYYFGAKTSRKDS